MKLQRVLISALCVLLTATTSGAIDEEFRRKYEKMIGQVWVESPADWNLEVRLRKQTLNIITTNVSKSDRLLVAISTFVDYEFTLTEKRTWPLSPVVRHYHIFDRNINRRLPRFVRPGARVWEDFPLHKLTGLKPDTRYQLQVTRLLDENNQVPVKDRPRSTAPPVSFTIPSATLEVTKYTVAQTSHQGAILTVLLILSAMGTWLLGAWFVSGVRKGI